MSATSIVPSELSQGINKWDKYDVEKFLTEDKTSYHLGEEHIKAIKEQEVSQLKVSD